MGWDINVFRMDFERLLKVHGCRSERLLQQMVSSYGLDEPNETDLEDEDYDEGGAPLSAKQALRNVLFNEVTDDTPDLGYGDAMAVIYRELAAEYIGDLRVAMSSTISQLIRPSMMPSRGSSQHHCESAGER